MQQIYIDDVSTSKWDSMICYLCNNKATYLITSKYLENLVISFNRENKLKDILK